MERNTETMRRPTGVLIVLALALAIDSAQAAMTLLSGPPTCTHVGNLVTNGSFEVGSPGPGPAGKRFWATGTTLTPFAVPPGWSSVGPSTNYAYWGSDSPIAPHRLRFSDGVPDGQVGMYFGNGGSTVSPAPIYNGDGSVGFASTPNFANSPVRLSQTVPTNTSPAPSYCLGFWVSGEGAGGPNAYDLGIFGLKVTNVLPGDPTLFLQVPNGPAGPWGPSRRYEFAFTPLNASLPVTVTFFNWGHIDLTAYGLGNTTELVLDDVIVNAVPEPASLLILAAGGLPMLRRRGRSAQSCV